MGSAIVKTVPTDKTKLPKPFIIRRLHSLLGFWLILYLLEHLLVNSQAAFYFNDDGKGFISLVNKIHEIPYLQAVEWIFLALPFLIHGIWGLKYAYDSKMNTRATNGSVPSLPQYPRNRAYSWQRITSWVLFIGIALHVFQMRILGYPLHLAQGSPQYLIWVNEDKRLPYVAEKLHVNLFDQQGLEKKQIQYQELTETLKKMDLPKEVTNESLYYTLVKQKEELEIWLTSAFSRPIKKGKILAASPNAGGAFFLMVREIFKSPIFVLLYSLLVIAACYHAFNGLWTFMITWGITLTRRSQKGMLVFSNALMGIVIFLGLLAAWGPYLTTIIDLGHNG